MTDDEKTIELKIKNVLIGDALKNALDFTAFLRANNLSPEWHDSGDGWTINHKNTCVGFILVNGDSQIPGPWTIWFSSCSFADYDAVDDELKETAWAHASVCAHFSTGGKTCGCGSQPGFQRTIFGKVFDNLCHSPLMFLSPDAKTLGHVKNLILMLTGD